MGPQVLHLHRQCSGASKVSHMRHGPCFEGHLSVSPCHSICTVTVGWVSIYFGGLDSELMEMGFRGCLVLRGASWACPGPLILVLDTTDKNMKTTSLKIAPRCYCIARGHAEDWIVHGGPSPAAGEICLLQTGQKVCLDVGV